MVEVEASICIEIDAEELVSDAEGTVVDIMRDNASELTDGLDIPDLVYDALQKIDILEMLVEQRKASREKLQSDVLRLTTQLKTLSERFNELAAERDAIKAERNGLLREVSARKG